MARPADTDTMTARLWSIQMPTVGFISTSYARPRRKRIFRTLQHVPYPHLDPVLDRYSLTNRGAYLIDDQSGKLWVVSDRGVPRKGARVTVKGTIREGFNLGTLGDRISLPAGIGSGLVMMESSHNAKN